MEYLTGCRLLWPLNYWDGPISGILEYQGRHYYFDRCDESDIEDETATWSRRYLVYELSKEEFNEEMQWHNLFREHVGTHTDYDEHGRTNHAVRPQSEHHKYYEKAKERTPRDYTQNKIIGWFER